jgi:hypothetical protein
MNGKYLILLSIFILSLSVTAVAGEKAPQKIVDLANSTLMKLGTKPVIVEAVKAQNSKNATLDQIKEMDKKWQANAGIADYMRAILDSVCGKFLIELRKSEPYYSEIFVMDNQGANVAMSDKTSDYWQGDEDKFIKSFSGGKGALFIDDVKFDSSSQTYSVQVSFPVKDGEKVIGAMTIGLDVDKVK